MSTDDTIAAISTPIGEGGIAIIRLSGPTAFAVADAIATTPQGRPSTLASHTIQFGAIREPGSGDLIDRVMIAVMRQPRTYTGEDTVEINCHGGLLTAQRILELCLDHGARLAEPGEFTRRAFLNGKLDLAQAESVMDLIHARTERAQQVATRMLDGHLSVKVNRLREILLTLLAHIEAHIDFPDEDISPESTQRIQSELDQVLEHIHQLIATAREGKILRDGVPVAIIGRPNAGKSSIMNALLGHDRSIVTPVAGTTRDTVEDYANIRGIPVRFTDTAGIRQARGVVERAGVERSHKALALSAIAIHVLDGSRPFHRSDLDLARSGIEKSNLLVINKIDLARKLELPVDWLDRRPVSVSAKTGDGIEQLKDRLVELIRSGHTGQADLDVAINERHAHALRVALNHLTLTRDYIASNHDLEIIAQSMRLGLDAIGEIVGKTTTEDILQKIFSTFCIGK